MHQYGFFPRIKCNIVGHLKNETTIESEGLTTMCEFKHHKRLVMSYMSHMYALMMPYVVSQKASHMNAYGFMGVGAQSQAALQKRHKLIPSPCPLPSESNSSQEKTNLIVYHMLYTVNCSLFMNRVHSADFAYIRTSAKNNQAIDECFLYMRTVLNLTQGIVFATLEMGQY